MPSFVSHRVLVAAALVVALALVLARVAVQDDASRAAQRGPDRAGGLSFSSQTAPLDRAAVLSAVAAARPQAREVIDAVDGRVDIVVGPTGTPAIGLTQSDDGVRYTVTLDLGRVSRRYGERGIVRLVLHELGHVVDFALVDRELSDRLDAQIPAGWGCENGTSGACASRAERFAESFAKWATGDIGMNLYLGYAVPPPASLDTWGQPLADLVRR